MKFVSTGTLQNRKTADSRDSSFDQWKVTTLLTKDAYDYNIYQPLSSRKRSTSKEASLTPELRSQSSSNSSYKTKCLDSSAPNLADRDHRLKFDPYLLNSKQNSRVSFLTDRSPHPSPRPLVQPSAVNLTKLKQTLKQTTLKKEIATLHRRLLSATAENMCLRETNKLLISKISTLVKAAKP